MQSEVSSVQQLDMFADAAQEQHLCLDCGVDILHQRLMHNVANVAHTSERRNAPGTTTGKTEEECYSVSRADNKRLNTSSHAKNGENRIHTRF